MRRCFAFLLLLCWPALAAEIAFSPLTGRVVDQAGVIAADTQQAIEAKLAEYERTTGNQVVVATVLSLQGLPIEDYGYRLGRFWGIGQKGADNGALLIVAPGKRQVRIEVGYGLEGELTDAASKMIIEQIMLPHFKRKDYSGGIAAGVDAMLAVLGGERRSASLPEERQTQDAGSGWEALLMLVFLFMLFRGLGRRRSGMLLPMVLGSMVNTRSGSWSGGGGFRGGGGSFGGGGASGRW